MRAILQVLYHDIQSPDRGLFGWECQPCGRRDVSLLALRYGSNVSLRLCSLTSCRPFQTANLSITFFGFSSPHAPLLAPCSYCRLGGAWFHSFLPCFRSPLAKTKKSQPLGVDPSRAVVYCLDSAREGQLEAEKEDDRSSPPSASTRFPGFTVPCMSLPIPQCCSRGRLPRNLIQHHRRGIHAGLNPIVGFVLLPATRKRVLSIRRCFSGWLR